MTNDDVHENWFIIKSYTQNT